MAYVGAAVSRREDARLLTGQGLYVADLTLEGMCELVFVRSQFACGALTLDLADAIAAPGVIDVISGRDASPHLPALPGMQVKAPAGWSERVTHAIELPAQPLLAIDSVHFVGEPIAAVVAQTRNAALDAAEKVEHSVTEVQPVLDPVAAAARDHVRVHRAVSSNVMADMSVAKGDVETALVDAPRRLTRNISHHRYVASPIECRAVAAQFDRRDGVLTVWSTTQVVHWVQAQIARTLGLSESCVRVIAPDVGGGFGVKGHVYPEELVVAWMALRLKRPVRWVEQRQEHLAGATHARDQIHELDIGFDESGRLLALRDTAWIDSGAFCPVGAGVAYNTPAHMLGPYDIPHFSSRTRVVATNKSPNAPYRGAGRPEAVQVMERAMDLVAAALEMEPAAVRFANLIGPHQMPYAVGLPYRDGQPIVYDSGDYVSALEQAIAAIGGIDAFRREQREAAAAGRLLGLGLGCYTEGTGVGPFEAAQVRIDKAGTVVVSVGACAQGQGHETVFAQVAADCWQVAPSAVVIRAGDTNLLASGYGTVGSRSTVTASMALKRASDALARKVLLIAGELLEAAVVDLELRDGGVGVRGTPGLHVSLRDVASAAAPGWQHRRPDGVSPELVETDYYEPSTVTWSYAANAAVVEVDRDTGVVAVRHYVEVHDAGVLVNPMLADGQIAGGIAQGLGGALCEAIIYDATGQLLSGSLMDYAMPRAADMPPLTIKHMQTPSTLNPLGFKGLGEGGAIAPPVVIANAVGDALRDSGHEFNHLPLRPERVLAAVRDL